jgi:hypothetical protein
MRPLLSRFFALVCLANTTALAASLMAPALITPAHADADAAEASRGQPLRIHSQFVILPRADFAEFEATFQHTLAQARQQLEGEFMGMLEPLAYMTDDLPSLAMVIGRLMEQFEHMAKTHRAEVHAGVPAGLADQIIATFDQYYRELGLADSSRKAQFSDLPISAEQALRKLRSGLALTPTEAANLRAGLDYLIVGGYSIMPGGTVSVAIRLVEVRTGRIHSFSVRDRASAVGAAAGRALFRFFQENRYAEWQNPAPQLTWIPQPAPVERVLASVARLACRSQGARLPYARELVQASLAGEFRRGGIERLTPHVDYIIADRQRSDEQHYYATGPSGQSRTGGPVHTSAGFGRITGYFWCVQGAPAPEVIFFESLYRVLRRVRATSTTPSEVSAALEFVLNYLEDFGALQDSSVRRRFPSIEAALALLQANGIVISIPAGL